MSQTDDTVQGYRLAVAKKYGVNVAIIYDKVIFWGRRGHRNDGWVFKSYAEMEDETALSTHQIGLAYKKLRDLGVIETKVMKVGKVPTLHFRLFKNAKSMENQKTQSPINKQNTTQNNGHLSVSFDGTEQPSAGVVEDTSKALLEDIIKIINPREIVTTQRLRQMNGRLKDVSNDTDSVRKAAVAFSKSAWHKENKQMTVDNLLAPSKFGKWHTLGRDEIIPDGDEAAAKKEKDRLWKLDADLEADAFRESRREEYWAARDSGQLQAYLVKYGLDDVYVL